MSGPRTPELYVERMARLTGAAAVGDRLARSSAVEWLARQWPFERTPWWLPVRDDLGVYCFTVAVVAFDAGVLTVVSYLVTGRQELQPWPVWYALPGSVVLAVWATLSLRRAYVRTVRGVSTGDALAEDDLLDLPTGWHRPAAVAVAAGLYLLATALDPNQFAAGARVDGVAVTLVRVTLVQAAIYMVVVGELAALVLTIHVGLPAMLWLRRPAVDFGDPAGYGGLRPLGRLLVRSSLLTFLGLVAHTVVTFLPVLIPTPLEDPIAFSRLIFPVLWVAAALLYLGSVVAVGRYVASEKRRMLADVDAAIRALDPSDADRSIPRMEPPADRLPELQYRYMQLREIRATREYPTDVGTLVELGLAALLPLALQVGLRAVGTGAFG